MPPASPGTEVSPRENLRTEVTEALKLGGILETVIHLRATTGERQLIRSRIAHGSPPWEASVAYAVTELWSEARRLEAGLRSEHGMPVRPRGGSDRNTRLALEALRRLCEAADDYSVRYVTGRLTGWNGRASAALGITELPRRLPRVPGQAEARCPWCGYDTLRQMPREGVVFCVLADCRDEEGRRPRGKLEWFAPSQEFVLRWQDMIIGAPA